MKYYFAKFTVHDSQVEVEFPDLTGCVTFGDSWEEAYENAVDVLAGWLAHAEAQFCKPPSTREQIVTSAAELVPIPVDENILQNYSLSKRFNIIFPLVSLAKVDEYRKPIGLKRSTLLLKAVEEYMANHQLSA